MVASLDFHALLPKTFTVAHQSYIGLEVSLKFKRASFEKVSGKPKPHVIVY